MTGTSIDRPRFQPTPGPQEIALTRQTDLTIFGGIAGCGKTEVLIMVVLLFHQRQLPANIRIVVKQPKSYTQAGSIFWRCVDAFSSLGARANRANHTIEIPMESGQSIWIGFQGLDIIGKQEVLQGGQIDAFLIEELGQFSVPERESQFFWLFSRSRSGMRDGAGRMIAFDPIVFCTTNPVLGWLNELVSWFIGPDGFPIWERSGQTRWVYRRIVENEQQQPVRTFETASTREELVERFPHEPVDAFSYTLVSATRESNPYVDWAAYDRKLSGLDPHERDRLKFGNWHARPFDRARIYHPGPGVMISPLGQAWAEVVELSRRQGLRHRGGWDYGRDRALAWVGGVLVPGAPPCLWITNAILFPDTDAAGAAAVRLREHVDRDRGLIYAGSLDFGDPAGRARDSGAGWAATLTKGGVDLSDLAHTYGDRGEFYWNSHAGRMEIRSLVKTWMNTGRLRVLSDVHIVVDALENWRRRVPEGVDPLDVDAENVPPQKDRRSHVADALGYLVAGVAEELRIESAEAREPAVNVELPLAQRRLLLTSMPGW